MKDIRKLNPEGCVLVLTTGLDPEKSSRIRAAGASEVLRKSVAVARIVATVRRLVGGGSRTPSGPCPAR